MRLQQQMMFGHLKDENEEAEEENCFGHFTQFCFHMIWITKTKINNGLRLGSGWLIEWIFPVSPKIIINWSKILDCSNAFNVFCCLCILQSVCLVRSYFLLVWFPCVRSMCTQNNNHNCIVCALFSILFFSLHFSSCFSSSITRSLVCCAFFSLYLFLFFSTNVLQMSVQENVAAKGPFRW